MSEQISLARSLAAALEGSWRAQARPDQLAPSGDWFCWLLLGGRGAGKSRSGAEWCLEQIAAGKRHIALVGATAADARNVMVEGISGILSIAPSWNMPRFNPSLRRLVWANRAMATLYSADEPERLRGPAHDAAWCDELGSWRRAETWSNLMFGLRTGVQPRVVVTTTPRPTKLVRELVSRAGTDVVISRMTTYQNRAHLAPAFLDQIIRKYEGTRLGRQELDAELLDDVPGALWQLHRIDELRVECAPALKRVVVGIDPSGGGGEEHDEVGIIAAGIDENGHGWVLADASGRYAPAEWARLAIGLYDELQADRVVAEQNYGGDMVQAVLRSIDPNVSYWPVTASRGKAVRAEPIAALYEQGRVHHVGAFPELEGELCSFTTTGYAGSESPGRADAMVWALTELMAQPMQAYGIFEWTRRKALGLPFRSDRPAGPLRPTTAHINGPRARIAVAVGSREYEQGKRWLDECTDTQTTGRSISCLAGTVATNSWPLFGRNHPLRTAAGSRLVS